MRTAHRMFSTVYLKFCLVTGSNVHHSENHHMRGNGGAFQSSPSMSDYASTGSWGSSQAEQTITPVWVHQLTADFRSELTGFWNAQQNQIGGIHQLLVQQQEELKALKQSNQNMEIKVEELQRTLAEKSFSTTRSAG